MHLNTKKYTSNFKSLFDVLVLIAIDQFQLIMPIYYLYFKKVITKQNNFTFWGFTTMTENLHQNMLIYIFVLNFFCIHVAPYNYAPPSMFHS